MPSSCSSFPNSATSYFSVDNLRPIRPSHPFTVTVAAGLHDRCAGHFGHFVEIGISANHHHIPPCCHLTGGGGGDSHSAGLGVHPEEPFVVSGKWVPDLVAPVSVGVQRHQLAVDFAPNLNACPPAPLKQRRSPSECLLVLRQDS